MKFLIDFLPVLVFFISFRFFGIYVATVSFIITSALQMSYFYFRFKKIEMIHLATFILGVILGGATLIFHNEIFIKWKPTLVYWFLGMIFIISSLFSEEKLIKKMLSQHVQLQDKIWQRLNLLWSFFFLLMGTLNLFVIYTFDTKTWVDFKLFGLMGLTLLFIFFQAFYIQFCEKSS